MSFNKETNMYEGYIYIITNNINKAQYVGQTNRTINKRYREHELNSKYYDYALYNAINKYGFCNFTINELEKIICESKDELSKKLDEREIYWIEFYNTYYNGYNETVGGKNNVPNKFPEKPIYEYDLQGNLLHEYKSVTDASDATGFSRSDISSCALRTKINRVQDKIFRFIDSPLTDDEKEFYINRYPKINQFDFDGNLLNTFDFLVDAIKYINENDLKGATNIAKVCNGKMKYAYGYIWRYYGDPFEKYALPLPKIEQHSYINGNLIALYKDYNEAAIMTNSDSSCINRCCNGYNSIHNGFIWCFEGKYSTDLLSKVKIKEKKVKQYNYKGDFIKLYNSIQEASDLTEIDRTTIGDVCRGIKYFAGGYVWRFEYDDFNTYKVDINKLYGYRKINQYTKDGKYIQTLNSSTEAKNIVNKDGVSPITACCKHKLKSAYGYVWYYADDPTQLDKSKIIA